ncbi:hypothetical protein K450DRAFT_270017 [Umbelopsis ramanniana AG]|uniref:Methyltransferase type 11 domain-containing protein n=1 Tax=Umbelopsis ramanniana AG TaxID=1314678 RepID=A0AAD5HFW7_UMBRA|nr:uncharacterized protein K450DRAFT_270017 [Umbelopsis ramanniana AG]KAI8581489.1 hypothetical protein K450DRAFT_270017 [Umbelopsis ramanniana AG]
MGNACSFVVRKRSEDESKYIISKEKSLNSNSVLGATTTIPSRIVGEREFHNDPKSVYVLAKDDIEKNRLNEQHFWVQREFWLEDIFPKNSYPESCHFAIGNVLQENPFGKRFDFIQMRYFAAALRANEWDEAYTSLYNQLKPGGYLQVLDTNVVKCTTDPELQDINHAFSQLLKSKGQDSDIGPKMATKMEAAGFNAIYNNQIEVPMGWGSKRSVRYAENMRSLYISIAPSLAEQLHIEVDVCKAKINRACDAMGPTKATVCLWSYLGQKPLDAPKSSSSL